MSPSQQVFLASSAFLGFLGVAAGAFGAHFLKSRLSPENLDIFEVAVRYQMYHVFALLGLAAMMGTTHSAWLIAAGCLFIAGTIIFSGSLYILVFSGIRAWGAVTPIGGIFLLIGWLSLLVGGTAL